MGSVTHAWSCQICAAGIPTSRRISPAIFRSLSKRCLSVEIFRGRPNYCVNKLVDGIRGNTAGSPVLTLPGERMAPWLMLPPASDESGNSVYNFYRLAEKNPISLKKRNGEEESGYESNMPPDNSKIFGSSQGWLVLFNSRNSDLYLSNPLSHRHIKLPTIGRLPDPDLKYGRGRVCSAILTCSPDEEECCAVVSLLPKRSLHFCVPGRSREWTPMIAPDSDEARRRRETVPCEYENFVYSSRLKLLFCLTRHKRCFVDVWDLGDPLYPRLVSMGEELEFDGHEFPQPGRNEEESVLKKELGWRLRYLVFVEESNELFMVVRYLNPRMGSDGSYRNSIFFSKYRGWDCSYPYKTFDFEVYRIELGRGKLSYLDGSLNGLSMFVGKNHSFALSASELKPDSIYFTDDELRTDDCGHDNGIFDYEDASFSSICNLCPFDYQSMKRMGPAPLWFTPDAFYVNL